MVHCREQSAEGWVVLQAQSSHSLISPDLGGMVCHSNAYKKFKPSLVLINTPERVYSFIWTGFLYLSFLEPEHRLVIVMGCVLPSPHCNLSVLKF